VERLACVDIDRVTYGMRRSAGERQKVGGGARKKINKYRGARFAYVCTMQGAIYFVVVPPELS